MSVLRGPHVLLMRRRPVSTAPGPHSGTFAGAMNVLVGGLHVPLQRTGSRPRLVFYSPATPVCQMSSRATSSVPPNHERLARRRPLPLGGRVHNACFRPARLDAHLPVAGVAVAHTRIYICLSSATTFDAGVMPSSSAFPAPSSASPAPRQRHSRLQYVSRSHGYSSCRSALDAILILVAGRYDSLPYSFRSRRWLSGCQHPSPSAARLQRTVFPLPPRRRLGRCLTPTRIHRYR
ncbi:hypothetical protein DFH06DRAFT_2757 [Mycena polygramma]|nr:hypothetical protein DFH06DRAFT_2757 [Mycena polygramma]